MDGLDRKVYAEYDDDNDDNDEMKTAIDEKKRLYTTHTKREKDLWVDQDYTSHFP
jgi:hypothetical protein